MSFFLGLLAGLFGSALAVPVILAIGRALCFYTTVNEGRAKVFVLFGRVLGVLDEPGLRLVWLHLGPMALLVPYFGKVHEIDIRLDQEYLRSQPVNSEEGTPMGIGVWYEMRVTDPVDYLFKNADPEGSLRANVANATVRSLSNMPLGRLLVDRHAMSRVVRTEVTPKAAGWGYGLGSVYIRKVHFRDAEMIRQIEQKVANRLLQVTSAIRQAGTNEVDIIKSAAEKAAATEFARAAAMRPQLVGRVMDEIAEDPEVLRALLEVLEVDRLLRARGELVLLPAGGAGGSLLAELLASRPTPGDARPDRPEGSPPSLAGPAGFASVVGVPPA